MNSVTKPAKRLARWIDEFQGYDFDIRYRRGREAIIPDVLSRRPDYFNVFLLNTMIRHDEFIPHLKNFLINHTLPEDAAMRERVIKEAHAYTLDEGEGLLHKIGDKTVPYIEPIFRGDFMEQLHHQFGHLSYKGMSNAVETRGWWPTMESDLRRFIAACPNCQVVQRQRVNQETEYAQIVTDPFIQPFQRWGIDLIGVLPRTASGNRWIITAIDYATGWPIAKALPKATEEERLNGIWRI